MKSYSFISAAILLLLIRFNCTNAYKIPYDPPRALNSSIIVLIDGVHFGITGETIAFMLRVRQRLIEMQQGTGLYPFSGTLYNIHDLSLIEKELKNASPDQSTALIPTLELAREDFKKKVMCFLGIARGAKQYLTKLIHESCKNHGKPDSMLDHWGAAPEGSEESQFDADITNFRAFDLFCTDLVHFLQDLMYSCPHALSEFHHMVGK